VPSRLLFKPVVAVALVVGLGAAAYLTRSRWLPDSAGDERPSATAHDHDHHDHDHADGVKLSPQALANLGLGVEPLVPETYTRMVPIPGTVVDRPGLSDRGVTAPVAGVITEVKVQPGDTVKPGEPLFAVRIVSELLLAAQVELSKAAKELQIATENRKRLEAVKIESVPGTRLTLEAEIQERRARAAVDALRQQLLAYGLRAEQVEAVTEGKLVTELTVAAPPVPGPGGQLVVADAKASPSAAPGPAFEVKELKALLGAQVTAGQVLGVLANHRLLYVEGRAFKSEATLLERAAEAGWPVRAEFAEEGGWPTFDTGLTIRHLANAVDPASRTFAFYLPLENQSRTFAHDGQTFMVWRFRPGQRVRLKVPIEQMEGVFVVPAGALVREGAEAFVFRQNGDLFERRTVRVLLRGPFRRGAGRRRVGRGRPVRRPKERRRDQPGPQGGGRERGRPPRPRTLIPGTTGEPPASAGGVGVRPRATGFSTQQGSRSPPR
jgi:multidrug efflux pump subunit AcrA (membrane-fusion protein)